MGAANDLGPSWRDVSELAHEVRTRWGIGLAFALVPPLKLNTGHWSGWGVTVNFWYLRKGSTEPWGMQERFGAAGAWKTAPSALHAALMRLDGRLEEMERSAAQQAAF